MIIPEFSILHKVKLTALAVSALIVDILLYFKTVIILFVYLLTLCYFAKS